MTSYNKILQILKFKSKDNTRQTLQAKFHPSRVKNKQIRKGVQSLFKSPVKIGLRAIFCRSHPTCDSRVFRISSYFNQLRIKVILEYGRKFIFIRHFVEFLEGRETTVVFQEIQSVSTSYILKAPSVS